MKNRLDEEMEILSIELIKMGSYCEEAIILAICALRKKDISYIEKVLQLEKKIDSKEKKIENMCMTLLLQHQPVATDLRNISSTLKMISDMERIGDQAENIAELIPYVVNAQTKTEEHINEMANEAIKMVNQSIDSFVKKDLSLAKHVIVYDNIVDDYFDKIKQELISLIAKDSDKSEYYINLFMIAKYLERIGDHATNIAEWVQYSITGSHKNS